jgi:hypothetical protein
MVQVWEEYTCAEDMQTGLLFHGHESSPSPISTVVPFSFIKLVISSEYRTTYIKNKRVTLDILIIKKIFFKFTRCTPPLSVNLICVVDTNLSPAVLSSTKDIHVSVPVTYLLYV